MARKKQEDPPKGAPAWMATFSDLMNLLLCFFVLLFSMSSVDAHKYDQVVESLKSAFSILTPASPSMLEGELVAAGISQLPDMANFFGDTMADTKGKEQEDGQDSTLTEGSGGANQNENKGMTAQEVSQIDESRSPETEEVSTETAQATVTSKALQESEKMAEQIEKLTTMYGIQRDVEVDYNGQYVRLTLNGAMIFESGAVDIRPEATRIVDRIGKILDNYQNSLIQVEGHTDNIPINSARYESNDVLSMYRAYNVAQRLRASSTVDPGNIMSAGRGDYNPIADNRTAEGRARNRRVEIKIYNSFNSGTEGAT